MAVGTADYSIKNLNEKTNAEIEGFLKKSKEELFNLRFQHATGQLENTARLKAVKSDIARMYTVRFAAATSCPTRWTRRLPSSSSSVRPTRCTARSFVPPARSRPMMNTTTPTLATS